MLSQVAQAKIIELDTFNPDHCRQQILSTMSQNPDDVQFPVIFTYISGCPWAAKLRPIVEQVSGELRKGLDGNSTKKDVEDFIKVDSSKLKNISLIK